MVLLIVRVAFSLILLFHHWIHRSRYLDSGMSEFMLQDMVLAAVTKVQTAWQRKGIIVSCNLAEKFLKQRLFGDCIRLQKILSDFLLASVKFCPVGGSVAISSNQTKNSIGGNINLIDLELRYCILVMHFALMWPFPDMWTCNAQILRTNFSWFVVSGSRSRWLQYPRKYWHKCSKWTMKINQRRAWPL